MQTHDGRVLAQISCFVCTHVHTRTHAKFTPDHGQRRHHPPCTTGPMAKSITRPEFKQFFESQFLRSECVFCQELTRTLRVVFLRFVIYTSVSISVCFDYPSQLSGILLHFVFSFLRFAEKLSKCFCRFGSLMFERGIVLREKLDHSMIELCTGNSVSSGDF